MPIIQKITGGLGNQMFQYAYIRALSLKHKVDFLLDIHEYQHYFRPFELEIFNIQKQYATYNQIPWYERLYSKNRYINYIYFHIKNICKKYNPYHYIEKNLRFDIKFLAIKKGYIEGYFQSEKYFQDYTDQIRQDFSFVQPLTGKNKELANKIQSCNSISVHVRRGDYLKGNNLSYHGICSLEYYQKAIEYIKSHVDNPQFFFFSDDIAWVKKNIHTGNNNDIYVDHNIESRNREDMRLMSLCKHNIIANSSFSRRGAWLNTN